MEHRHSSPGLDQGIRNQSPHRPLHGNHAVNPAIVPASAGTVGDDEHRVHTHGQHAGHSVAMFRDRFWLTLALAVPVVFFSPMFAELLGYEPPAFPGSAWIPPVFGTAIFLYGGRPFIKGGLNELRTRNPGMMLLIAMAISVAFIASWVTSLGIGGFDLDFWWELALLVPIMLLGHWIEMRALGSAQGALDALAALLPDEAERVTDAGTEAVSVSELRAGDNILVRPGGRMPADGTVSAGQAEFDESMITGESKTVLRAPGDPVVAGTIATDNSVRVRVSAIGEDTALAGIQRLVAEAQASSSRAQALADRAAAFLFYFAAGTGVLTFMFWTLMGSVTDAVTRTVTVLVIACPHALGLAIPLVIAISTERAARAGVLIKNRMALERMRTVDVVLFDKTGTLTRGEPELKEVAAATHRHCRRPGRSAWTRGRRGGGQRTSLGPLDRCRRPGTGSEDSDGGRVHLADRPGSPRRDRWPHGPGGRPCPAPGAGFAGTAGFGRHHRHLAGPWRGCPPRRGRPHRPGRCQPRGCRAARVPPGRPGPSGTRHQGGHGDRRRPAGGARRRRGARHR